MGPDGPADIAGRKAAAFCGLGNPDSFWKSIAALGIAPLEQCAFDDHQRYRPAELRRLARHAVDLGAEVLLTTAKDAMNLDPDYRSIVAPLELYWLEIGMEIDGRERLNALIAKAAKRRLDHGV